MYAYCHSVAVQNGNTRKAYLSSMLRFTFNEYVKYFHNIQDYEALSTDSRIDKLTIIELIDKDWDFWKLSKHPSVDMDVVNMFPHKDWCYCQLYLNPNVQMKHILANWNKPWDWRSISSSESLTYFLVSENIKLPWNIACLMKNRVFTPAEKDKLKRLLTCFH